MPSSNKTKNIGLSYWYGTDKPKKDDFNSDNLIIDREIQGIRKMLASEYVATIRHDLDHIPIGTLYRTEYAAGIRVAWEGPAGGDNVTEVPSCTHIVDSQTIDLFTIPGFLGAPEIIKASENEYYMVFPYSSSSLILILR